MKYLNKRCSHKEITQQKTIKNEQIDFFNGTFKMKGNYCNQRMNNSFAIMQHLTLYHFIQHFIALQSYMEEL